MSAAGFDFRDRSRRETLDGFRYSTDRTGKGVCDDDPILLGEFYDAAACQILRRSLAKSGIAVQSKKLTLQTALYVNRRHSTQAFDLLAQHLQEHPNVRPRRLLRAYDLAIFVLIAVSVTSPIIGLATRSPWIALAFWLTGAFVARTIACAYQNLRKYGHYRFSLWQLFVVIATSAVLSVIWRVALGSI